MTMARNKSNKDNKSLSAVELTADEVTVEVSEVINKQNNETNEVSDMNLLAQAQQQQAQQAPQLTQAQIQQAHAQAHTQANEQAAHARAQAMQANERFAREQVQRAASQAHEQAQAQQVQAAQAAFDAGLEQQPVTSAQATTGSGSGSMFDFSHESGGISGAWLGAGVAGVAAAATSFLSSDLGIKDAAAIAVAGVGGFAAGHLVDKYVTGSMLRPAASISAGAAIGVGASTLTNKYFGTTEVVEDTTTEVVVVVEAPAA